MPATAPSGNDAAAHSPGPHRRRLPAGYGYEWARFVDWCAATDHTPLPAHPVTVAEFLDDHPAPPGTQRRRLAAVTAAHSAAGHPSPARAAAIRALLHPVTGGLDGQQGAATADQTRQLVDDVLTHLPTVSWPHGLFGRRDALLLLLTHHARLGPTAAVRLRRGDLTTTPDRHLAITTGPFDQVLLPPNPDTRRCPACIHRRWAQVLTSTDADQTRRTLRATLHTGTPPGPDSPHPCTRPGPAWSADGAGYRLLTAVDGWGWLPWEGTGLTPKAAAGIVTAHLTGAPPAHRTLRVPAPAGEQAPAAAAPPPPPTLPATTAADRAAQAAAALLRRRTDVQALTAASDNLAGLDTRLQELLQRTLDLLADTTPPPVTSTR
jgi:hypothetical protein